jgi:hypothetical protein
MARRYADAVGRIHGYTAQESSVVDELCVGKRDGAASREQRPLSLESCATPCSVISIRFRTDGQREGWNTAREAATQNRSTTESSA